jgi:hypothetical protein
LPEKESNQEDGAADKGHEMRPREEGGGREVAK